MKKDFELFIGVNMLYAPDSENCDWKNSFQVQHLYVDRVVESGALPLIIPPIDNEKMLHAYIEKVDAFVFIGGPDYPPAWFDESPHPESSSHRRFRCNCDMFLMREVLKLGIPVLGICAGEQLMNIALGGKLIQHIENSENHIEEQYHNIKIVNDSILHNIIGESTFEVNSSHHQAVHPEYLCRKLRISALADDGTVEALEGTGDEFWLGLQFHIERHKNKKFSKDVFDLLVKKAREYKNK